MEGGVKQVHAVVYPAHLNMHHQCLNSVWGFPCPGWETGLHPAHIITVHVCQHTGNTGQSLTLAWVWS